MTKVLETILGQIMYKLISCNQSIFLKRIMLVDEVVVVIEVINSAKRYNKTYLIFKVDFEKEYDSDSWSF